MSRVSMDSLIAHIARREERWTFRVHDGVRVFALQLRKLGSAAGMRRIMHAIMSCNMSWGRPLECERQCMNEKGPLRIS
jgi:hypothetical protein